MKTLTHIAIDLDGPLLLDTFSPIMRKTCQFYGWPYTAEFERRTLSQSRAEVSRYIRETYRDGLPIEMRDQSDEAMIESYFRFRAEFLQEHPNSIQPGVVGFLDRLKSLDVTLICYGGLEAEHMKKELGNLSLVFDRYVCTDKIRPGLKEIIQNIYELPANRFLFLDDVNLVAEHAKRLGTGFIGIPAAEDAGWQKHDMLKARLPYIVSHLDEIDGAMIHEVDERLTDNTFWVAKEI